MCFSSTADGCCERGEDQDSRQEHRTLDPAGRLRMCGHQDAARVLGGSPRMTP
jgi:hypothetical protein